jgi:hypothetical protein
MPEPGYGRAYACVCLQEPPSGRFPPIAGHGQDGWRDIMSPSMPPSAYGRCPDAPDPMCLHELIGRNGPAAISPAPVPAAIPSQRRAGLDRPPRLRTPQLWYAARSRLHGTPACVARNLLSWVLCAAVATHGLERPHLGVRPDFL